MPRDGYTAAAPRLRLLVHPGAPPGGGPALQRSDGAGSFLLFLILSSPLGLHHQVTDPGIHEGWKLFQAFLTFAVFFPSLLTFFNVVASLEGAGRARGGKGLFGWFTRLPWGDPSLAAQLSRC
jgi:hypothetical protein